MNCLEKIQNQHDDTVKVVRPLVFPCETCATPQSAAHMDPTRRIYSGNVEASGGAVIVQGDINANGHVTIINNEAQSAFRLVKESPDAFGSMQDKIQHALSNLLSASHLCEQYSKEDRVDESKRPELANLAEACQSSFRQLETLQTEFERWGTQDLRREEVSDMVKSIEDQVERLEGINSAIVTSTIEIEKKLQRFINEVKCGDRNSTTTNSASLSSLSTTDAKAWTQLRRELQGVGISPTQFDQYRDKIVKTLQNAFVDEFSPPDSEAQERKPLSNKASRISRLISTITGRSTQLLRAIDHDDYEGVRTALAKGANVNTRVDSSSALHIALLGRKNLDIISTLIDCGANLGARTKDDETPLMLAIKSNDLKIVETLLKGGAASSDNMDEIEFSEWMSSNIRAKDDEYLEYIIMFMEYGMDASGAERALHTATHHNNLKMVEELLKHGVDVNAQMDEVDKADELENPYDHDKVVELKKRKLHQSDLTPLHTAARRGQVEMAELLLSRGADINAITGFSESPLHLVTESRTPSVSVIKVLLAQTGLDINLSDGNGRTALHIAARHGQSESIKALLAHTGLDVNLEDTEGQTALHIAAEYGQLKLVEALLAHPEIDINPKDNKGRTALHVASKNGKPKLVRLLLEKVADVDTKDFAGRTALHYGVSRPHVEVIRILIDAGASVRVEDNSGRTPLDTAGANEDVSAQLRAAHMKQVMRLQAGSTRGNEDQIPEPEWSGSISTRKHPFLARTEF